jgi:zinc/manganese transport system permease protein
MVMPAASGWRALAAGMTIGAAAYAAGLAASALGDLPGGPAIVVALAVFALLAGNMAALAAARTSP